MKRWHRDSGLSMRMFLTMFMLFVVYIAFIGVLSYLGLPLITILLFAGVMLFAQYYYSDKMVLYSTGARVVTESEEPGLHEIVSRLCIEADLPKPRVAVVKSSVPNAFATGRSPKKAVVAVTTALMQRLDRNEISAVLAHELTHVKNRDVMVLTIASFFSTIAFFLVRYLMFFGGDRRGGGQILVAWVVSIAVWIISYLLIRALSRYREFAADRGAAIITGHPSHLVSALMKISGSMDRVPTEDLRKAEGMNAFYIIPAIAKKSSVMALFSTHPSLEKRVAALEKISREMELA